ncbi:SPOR domain-containing protein [Komagataeibacter medellinensis]|uniref:SPOR domain-containing protein n=1 Tax=Komagataeibacter medellinensis TaxID=1177712 RepID=A0ABQ6VTG1_9PROT|nr:SPOR domain-containing protein [Komagataeibacter medellinensis]KAB8123471.1 SPOR domain-containing protein [Komagataeibacter medellinensis]
MSPDETPPPGGTRNGRPDNPVAPDPYTERTMAARERMGADSDPDHETRTPMEPADERPASRPPRGKGGFDIKALMARMAGSSLLGDDPLTRRLVYGAAGLGGVLVVAIGGWSLFGHHQGGIPVLGPPPGPVRVKPADPGGMQILGAADGMPADGGVMRLSPPPEQPQPDAMARQYGQTATGDDTGAAAPVGSAPPGPQPVPAQPPADMAAAPAQPAPPQPSPAQPAAQEEGTQDDAQDESPAAPPSAPRHLPAPTPRATSGASQGTGSYGVQLAALDTHEAAQKSWSHLASRYPDLFGSYQPSVIEVQKGGKTLYRLRVKGLGKAQATALCEKAKAKSLPCDLVHS